jgi:hypothetical protein
MKRSCVVILCISPVKLFIILMNCKIYSKEFFSLTSKSLEENFMRDVVQTKCFSTIRLSGKSTCYIVKCRSYTAHYWYVAQLKHLMNCQQMYCASFYWLTGTSNLIWYRTHNKKAPLTHVCLDLLWYGYLSSMTTCVFSPCHRCE